MMRWLLVLLCCWPVAVHASLLKPNGLYVSVLNHEPTLARKEKIDQLIRDAQAMRMNRLFVQIYRANIAWFPSKVGDDAPYRQAVKQLGFDPLSYVIQQAHQRGIQVHAWVNLLSLSQNRNAPLLKKHGVGILTRDLQPKKILDDYKIDNQFFLEPSDARVRHDLRVMVKEILKAYPHLDGIQFDYIRYPDVHPAYGYSPANVLHFKRATGQQADERNQQWRQWKRDQVTSLLSLLTRQARALRPKILVSTTGCVSYIRAMEEAFQDWPSWVNTGMVDFVTMMDYPPDAATYEQHIIELQRHVKDFSKVNIALGAYKFVNNADIFKQQYDICRKSQRMSCVVFHYDSLLENRRMLEYLRE